MHDYAGRLRRLQQHLRDQGVELAVFGATDNMRYLTGWAEHGHERLVGLLVPREGTPAFLVPQMNVSQAAGNLAGIHQVIGWDDGAGWHDAFQSLVDRWRTDRDGVLLIDDELHAAHLLGIQRLLPAARYRPASEMMTRLREIKSPEEIDALTRAAQQIDAIYAQALEALRAGMTERDLQEWVLEAIRQSGSRPSFTPLICFGPNGAVPHHSPGDTPLQPGDIVIIDIGCVVEGYPSDITRTVSFGAPSDPDADRIYRIVHAAHHAARATARPGVTGEEVDAAARRVIEAAGYGAHFIHRTGHGIGLSTHEPPDIVRGNTRPLQEGMCFSIEPGIYLPGRFGVRIENIVTVTADGVRSLNAEVPDTLPVVAPGRTLF
ncbi:MAG: Xaa-Pro peptidase family protein [Chloroherpetonaceae bacterium]|nr:Xaa-Pro peptidase family protein [Chloroherpetonaceae bacterium]